MLNTWYREDNIYLHLRVINHSLWFLDWERLDFRFSNIQSKGLFTRQSLSDWVVISSDRDKASVEVIIIQIKA